jgi:Tol biopolymer transport system component
MLIGVRSTQYGSSTILAQGNKASGIGTKFGYTSWHPSGKIAAYSLNKVRQFFHTTGSEVRGVVDLDSAICYYDLESGTVKTTEALKLKDRLESYPAWSADGKYLYYCSAPKLWPDTKKLPPDNFDKTKYDLMRISYDINTDKWGQPETFLSADETGLSILIPRLSPDGRFLLFTMCDHGCFPIYHPDSDLYMMDLESREYHKLDINSDTSESWHSFSSNSRWIAFSSKRMDGLYTRTFFSYVDKNGKVYKPFVMPQRDPEFYDSLLMTYSVPELIKGPIKVSHRTLARTIYSAKKSEIDVPITAATQKADGPNLWQERE